MKRFAKIIMTMAAFATISAAAVTNVHAEGLSVSADKESCEIGDTVKVTIDASAVGDAASPADVEVTFDPNRLNFVNCSAEYGGGGGGLVTFKDKSADVEFTTLSGGDALVSVKATGDAASPESANVTIAVNGEDTAASLISAETSSTGVAPGTVDAGDGRVVQAVFADEFKPVLFHKETTDYKGQTVECAKFDMGDMTLLYTTDASGGDGKFMIYDAASGVMSEVRMIQGIENRFIIVLSDCEGPIPEGYTKAVLEWNGQTLTAFMEESVAAGTSQAVDGVDPSDFFLVYAMSSEGHKGWYRYDKNEGTYQRFINTAQGGMTADADADEEGSGSGLLDEYIPANIQSILLLVFAPLAIILLVTVIILAVKAHDLAEDLDAFYEDYYANEEEYEGEEEEEEVYERPHKQGAVTAASLVGRSMSEDDEEDEEDEEAEEEVEEEAEEDIREEAEDEEDEDDVKYYKPLTRKERKELDREEKWRLKEEKKAAKRRAQGFEENTPMDWSTFEKGEDKDKAYTKSKPPKYMTESMEPIPEEEEEVTEKAPLPPRKMADRAKDNEEAVHPAREEDSREKQRRLFEQQQRIEEQRRIEKERLEEEQQAKQQQFIESKTEDLDLDEDFQFEFLNL